MELFLVHLLLIGSQFSSFADLIVTADLRGRDQNKTTSPPPKLLSHSPFPSLLEARDAPLLSSESITARQPRIIKRTPHVATTPSGIPQPKDLLYEIP